jgi:Ran GTPase-activating protein (RanGAP) involved in mRNA processing and transport
VGSGNPDAPQIGDVRIHYKVAKPGSVTVMAKQSKSSFEPYAPEGRAKTDLILTGEHSAESMLEKAQSANQMMRWLMLAGGVLLIGLGAFLVLRWRVHSASGAPPEGIGANVGVGVLALLVGVSLALVGFGSRWLAQDPVIGGGMMGGGAAALGLVLGGARIFKPSLFSGAVKWTEEEKKAFRKVALDPENPDLRLELASVLEKKGNPMGEFIRVSHELEALPDKDERREELDNRSYTLLDQHGRAWFQPLRRFNLVPEVIGTFYPAGWIHHGVIDEVVLDLPGILPERAEEFFAAVPGLRVLQMNAIHTAQGIGGWKDTRFEPDVPAIMALPQMKQIGVLRMSSMLLKTEDLEAIAASANLVNLVELDFSYNQVGPRGAAALAESATLKKLRVLEVRGCELGEDGAVALAKSANLSHLTTLSIGANAIGKAGMKALASSSNLKQLQVLAVDDNELGPIGCKYVAVTPLFRQLTSIDLGRNDIGSESMTDLAKSPNLARVTTLKLNENKLRGPGVRALASSPHLGKIKLLDLSFNEVDDDGGKGLAACQVIHDLEELVLSYNKIGDVGLAALAGWTGLVGIKKLALRENKFGPVGIKALAGSPHLKGIKDLDLSNNEIGLAGAKVLANATTLKDLEHLWLNDVKLGSDAEEILRDRFGDVVHL